MIEETLRIGIGHMTKKEAGIEMAVENLVGAEDKVDLETEIGQTQGTK